VSNAAYTRIGGRKVDMSPYPATRGALTRQVRFVADLNVAGGATGAQVKLSNITDAEDVTGAGLVTASSSLDEQTSSPLTAGAASGNVRTDHAAVYEVYLKMNGGVAGTDQVVCTNARLVITYS
jgi:hypothetical protein